VSLGLTTIGKARSVEIFAITPATPFCHALLPDVMMLLQQNMQGKNVGTQIAPGYGIQTVKHRLILSSLLGSLPTRLSLYHALLSLL